MKTRKKFGAILLLVALLAAVIAFLLPSASPAYAAGAYSFEITNFTATYDVHSDRTIDIEERVTIHYTGYASTGFYRDLPVNVGDRVYDANVTEINSSGSETAVDYTVELEDEFVILNIGDYSNKTDETHTYMIRYTYAVTAPTNPNALFLNVIGFGSEGAIHEGNITLNLPDGFESANLYVGDTSLPSNDLMEIDGNAINISLSSLRAFEGATVDLFFAEGVLSTRFDFTPYIMVIVGCVIIAALAAVKFLVFPKKPLTPVVTFEPPRGMDPVEVSKLIDNKVENSCVTSLIFYWASKGYLKIDFSDEDDPLLIRINNHLPDDAPKHQTVMYNALFGNRDMVKISQLEGKFYTVVERVKKLVDQKHRGLYTAKSVGVSVAFAVAGGLLMALTPIILGMAGINAKLIFFPALLSLVPAFVIYGLTQAYAHAVNKLKNSTKWLILCGITALCALFTALYAWLLPSPIMELAPKIAVCIVSYIVITASVSLITRTDDYTAMLNEIVGFRNFILYTEKDRLEAMLKENPEFYYQILPYAQVLGVSDIWEDKFKDLTVEPPQWLTDPLGTYVTFALVNRAMRMSMYNMTAHMVSRPSAPSSRSYSGGGFRGGGGFGGHGGGGHGGGGFRGR